MSPAGLVLAFGGGDHLVPVAVRAATRSGGSLTALRLVRRHSAMLVRASAVVLAGYGSLLALNQLGA